VSLANKPWAVSTSLLSRAASQAVSTLVVWGGIDAAQLEAELTQPQLKANLVGARHRT